MGDDAKKEVGRCRDDGGAMWILRGRACQAEGEAHETAGVTALWCEGGKGREGGEVTEVRPGSPRPSPEDSGERVLERGKGFSGGESQVSVQEGREQPGWVEWETQHLWGLGLSALFIARSSPVLPVPAHTAVGPA